METRYENGRVVYRQETGGCCGCLLWVLALIGLLYVLGALT